MEGGREERKKRRKERRRKTKRDIRMAKTKIMTISNADWDSEK